MLAPRAEDISTVRLYEVGKEIPVESFARRHICREAVTGEITTVAHSLRNSCMSRPKNVSSRSRRPDMLINLS